MPSSTPVGKTELTYTAYAKSVFKDGKPRTPDQLLAGTTVTKSQTSLDVLKL